MQLNIPTMPRTALLQQRILQPKMSILPGGFSISALDCVCVCMCVKGIQCKSSHFILPLTIHERRILFPNLLSTLYFMKNFKKLLICKQKNDIFICISSITSKFEHIFMFWLATCIHMWWFTYIYSIFLHQR